MRANFDYQWKISDIKSKNEMIRTRRGSNFYLWGEEDIGNFSLPSGQLSFSGKSKQAAADLTVVTSHINHQFYFISESLVIMNSRSVNVSLGSHAWPDVDATADYEMERIAMLISLANELKSIIFITFTEKSQKERENTYHHIWRCLI